MNEFVTGILEVLKHSDTIELKEIQEGLNKIIVEKDREIGVGGTGSYPSGKSRPDDEGALVVSVTTKGDNVFMNFGKPVGWLSAPKQQMKEIALQLLKRCE